MNWLRAAVALTAWLVIGALAGCTGEISNDSAALPDAGPNALGCPAGQQSCFGRCVDLTTNPQHCGTCTTQCAEGEFCQQGGCRALCAVGEVACDGACRVVASDTRHCGDCQTACQAGEFCDGGHCSATCSRETCETVSGLECADTSSNPHHCGACGASCLPGQSCAAGVCVRSCPDGFDACGDACVATDSDPENCGACGRACAVNVFCSGGQCGCADGKQLCAGVCVDTTSDAQNCGICAKKCQTSELCEQGICKPKQAGCSPGSTLCGASCVDTQTSSTHCGRCDNPCASTESCKAGTCQCAGSATRCGTSCVDTQTSSAHCGGCNQPCAAPRACVAGSCACVSGLSYCAGACVNVKQSSEHCGRCNNPCQGGSVCQNGVCACPNTQRLCDGTCVDTQTSLQHCGGCNAPCAAGQVCSAGNCEDSIGADGCGGLATGLTITEVAVYQSVKIPITNGVAALDPTERIADVVQGRDTVFRVFFQLEPGWQARTLSARLLLTNDGVADELFSKQSITKSSTDSDTQSTFQLFVPKEKIGPNTRYVVQIVECGAATGAVLAPRAPASADAALGARKTGVLKVRVVPITANAHTPDTSDAALAVYRAQLLAMYPIDSLDLSVATPIGTAYPLDWSGLLDQVRAKRQSDAPAGDVYYYGFVKPTDTFSQYCGSSCTAGIGFVAGVSQSGNRAAVGIAYADGASASTMAHEIGHNHGRNHAPCAPGNNITGVDTSYPYPGGVIGVWGYDSRTRVLYDPARATDIMGYCSNKWISDYTYRGITNRVVAVNGTFDIFAAPAAIARFRVVIADARGARWGIPFDRPGPAFGEPEQAEILNANGQVIVRVTVYRSLVPDIAAATLLVPEPLRGWHAIRVQGQKPLAYPAP